MTDRPIHWRPLGEIIVAQGLLTEGGLKRALEEQQRTGELLGQILVSRGWVSQRELAQALEDQQRNPDEAAVTSDAGPEASEQSGDDPARRRRQPLGRLLIEKGVLSENVLDRALDTQRRSGSRLGEILVQMGAISEDDLARTLTQQHGFDLTLGLRARLAAGGDGPPSDPGDFDDTYLVREAGGEPIHVASTFLDATDLAFELIDARNPDGLDIVRARGGELEIVWSYRGKDDSPAAAPLS